MLWALAWEGFLFPSDATAQGNQPAQCTMWQEQFPNDIVHDLVTYKNPHRSINNSKLELVCRMKQRPNFLTCMSNSYTPTLTTPLHYIEQEKTPALLHATDTTSYVFMPSTSTTINTPSATAISLVSSMSLLTKPLTYGTFLMLPFMPTLILIIHRIPLGNFGPQHK